VVVGAVGAVVVHAEVAAVAEAVVAIATGANSGQSITEAHRHFYGGGLLSFVTWKDLPCVYFCRICDKNRHDF
jgi:hypothetical protein